MKHHLLPFLSLITFIGSAHSETLSMSDVIARGIARSPLVTAVAKRTTAAKEALDAAQSAAPFIVEIAPGLGFTNGNALLSKPFDIAGARASRVRIAKGELDGAVAGESAIRLQVSEKLGLAYIDVIQAVRAEKLARESFTFIKDLVTAVTTKVGIGDAPLVDQLRAEIELAKAEHEVLRTSSDTRNAVTALNRMLDRDLEAELSTIDVSNLPAVPKSSEFLINLARTRHPFILAARAETIAADGAIGFARTLGRPMLNADIATDFWSLDRQASQRALGFQLRYSVPVGPNPAVQATIRRREAEFSAVEATLRSVEEEVSILVERRWSELRTSRDTAIRFQMEVLPRVERLLKATQTGYTTGISTVIDVIGAQRELNLARKEFDTLSMDAVRAAITLETAVGETIK